jgi:hypothetical protein
LAEKSNNLYSQYKTVSIFKKFGSFLLVTSVGPDQIPSRCLFPLRYVTKITVRMTSPVLSQGYLLVYISAWSSLQTVPPVWKRISNCWITPVSYQIILITEQPIGASSLSSYPGQTSCLSLFGICYRRVRGIRELLHRKYDALSYVEKSYETSL